MTHYQRSLIFNKAIEIEKLLDDKLCVDKKFVHDINLYSKIREFNTMIGDADKLQNCKKELQLLKEIRNALAHKNDFKTINKQQNIKKIFKEITKKDTINFEDFSILATYISSLNTLILQLNTVEDSSVTQNTLN